MKINIYFYLLISVSSILFSQTGQAGVKIGVSDWPGWVAWYIADRKGYFAAHDTEVELIWFDRYTDSIDALIQGDLDANSQAWSDTLPLLVKGHKLELVLINDTSAGNDAIVTHADITEVEQLRGKRIALEINSLSHLLLDNTLQHHGMTTADVTLVDMPAKDATRALSNGLVDAAVSWNPWISKTLNSGKARLLLDSSMTPGLIIDALIARSDRLSDSDTQLQFIRLVHAWFDTVAFIREHPEEAATIMAEVTNVNREDYLKLLPGTAFFGAQANKESMNGALQDSTKDIVAYLLRHKVIDTPPDYEQAINKEMNRAASHNYHQK